MQCTSREAYIRSILSEEPSFRARQALAAVFSSERSGWEDITELPAAIREKLSREAPWNVFREIAVLPSRKQDTWKGLLEAADGSRIESVLMRNSRGQLSVCVSTQVGCAMGCAFCATGKLGFSRNLSVDEIVDQVRFFKTYAREHRIFGEITNVVFMGMGEPLANYDNVKTSLMVLTKSLGIGVTRITVSTVGLVPMLEKLIDDAEWLPVRLAVSLHSADSETRKALMPTSYDDFLAKLAVWTRKYFEKFPEKRRHITFEYILLSGVNDTLTHAEKLIRFARQVGKVRINLIPYNHTDEYFRRPSSANVEAFQNLLKDAGIIVTCRRAMGEDIAAACGQLAAKEDRSYGR